MRKKKITDPCHGQEKEFEKQLSEVEFAEEPTVELLKELIKVNQEIKEILLQLKNRFI